VRVGVIGLGSIGRRHVRNVIALGHAVIGYDNGHKALWLEDQCGWAHSLDHLLDHGLDAVLICTPAVTHATVATQLHQLGYRGALFVEKPIDLVADRAIFQGWEHPTTMVGYNWRFHPQTRPIVTQPPADLHLVCETNMAAWPGQAYGPPVLECSHEIDLALATGAEFTTAGTLDHDAGLWLMFQRPHVLVDLWWRADRSRRSILRPDGAAWHRQDLDLGLALDRSYLAELEHFLDCAQRRVPTEVPFAAGLRVIEVAHRAEAMALGSQGVARV
jgi:predicted dehydrogenase